jgi:hypothetical protein
MQRAVYQKIAAYHIPYTNISLYVYKATTVRDVAAIHACSGEQAE